MKADTIMKIIKSPYYQ